MWKTLAIETSCDDTSLSIVYYDWKKFIDKKTVSFSQIQDHQQYWWVVPELASRLHSEKIIEILKKIWIKNIKNIDFISTTSSPWLPWSLIVWIASWHMLGNFLDKPVIEVNHILWHIFSIFINRDLENIKFPMITLSASWWHNEIYLINRNKFNFEIKKLGQTLDDAAWESFDKVSRFLGWSYPWWPWIAERASKWKSNDLVKFSRIFLKAEEFNFSFSGMKSQVYYLLKNLEKQNIDLNDELINDICYEYQEAVVEVLAKKLIKAAKIYSWKSISIVWWVSANDKLRNEISFWKNKRLWENVEIFRPISKAYCMDNWTMIGVAGLIKFLNK